MNLATFTKTGTKAATPVKLDKFVFESPPKNYDLLKLAYTAHLANGRRNLAVTKKRGEVNGGGRKPWKQKGTGRARAGSSRSPIWRGGGVTFGPTGQENYSLKLPVAQKRLAIRQALSLAAKSEKVKIIETFASPEGRVKPTLSILDKIGATKKVLIITSLKDDLLNRSTRNIPDIKVIQAKYLTVFDILNADNIVISIKGLDIIQDWLGEKK